MTKLIKKIIVDILCLLVVNAILEILRLEVIHPFKRGFYCNDESTSYPRQKNSTVTSTITHNVGIYIPIVSITLEECSRQFDTSTNPSFKICNYLIPNWLASACSKIGVFYFGAALTEITTEVTKCQIGQLRPYFLHLCIPDVDYKLQHLFIQKFNCTSNLANPKNLRNPQKSFLGTLVIFFIRCSLLGTLFTAKVKGRRR